MTTRTVFVLALRVAAILVLLPAISGFGSALLQLHYYEEMAQTDSEFAEAFGLLKWSLLGEPVLRLSLAILLFVLAGPIGSAFYGREEPGEAQASPPRLTARELTCVGGQLLGIYALVQTIHPLSVAVDYIPPGPEAEFKRYIAEAVAYAVVGLVLLIGGWALRPLRRHMPGEEPTPEEPA